MFPEIFVIFFVLLIGFWPMLLLTHGAGLAFGLEAAWLSLIPFLLWFRGACAKADQRRDARLKARSAPHGR